MKTLKLLMAVFAGLVLFGCNDDDASGDRVKTALFIPFAGNGYVTPLDPMSTETPAVAEAIIRSMPYGGNYGRMVSWERRYVEAEPHQLSIFFYTRYTGDILLSLVIPGGVAGDAVLGVEIEGHTLDVRVKKSNKNQVCFVGRYNIAKPGYVRVNIVPIETEANSYPLISALKLVGSGVGNVTERCEDVMFVTEEDASAHIMGYTALYAIRRAPYVVLNWKLMSSEIEYFYNEVNVSECNDVKGAYFMTTGGSAFYMGIQAYTNVLELNGRVVLFSVWDTNTVAGDVAELVNKGEGVVTNLYDNEGSGIQCFYPYEWKTDRTYATMVRVRPEVIDGKLTGASLYTGYFRGDEGWKFIAEVRRPKVQTYIGSPYSFNENFMDYQGWVPRTVSFPSQWMRDKDGNWHEVVSCKFSNGFGVNNYRYDYGAGVNEQGDFYLSTAGYIDFSKWPEDIVFTRQPSGTAPDIDLAALEQMAKAE